MDNTTKDQSTWLNIVAKHAGWHDPRLISTTKTDQPRVAWGRITAIIASMMVWAIVLLYAVPAWIGTMR